MATGLTSAEARRRLTEFGENRISSRTTRRAALTLFVAQFKSPIILILIGAAILSLFLQERTDATLILAIVLASAVLGFWQEYSATNAVAKLRALVETKVRVLRDGNEVIHSAGGGRAGRRGAAVRRRNHSRRRPASRNARVVR